MMFQLPEQISAVGALAWTFASYGQKAAMSTAFGPSGIVLMDLAAKINPGARVFFIDTGYHFEETLQMVDRVQKRFDIHLEVIKPNRSVADQEAEYGELYTLEPDRCCAMRKVEPNQRMLENMDAWITGLRRDQSRSRAGMAAWSQVQTDTKTILKVNPLIRWTKKDVWTHIHKEQLPYNPLHDEGYLAVGCKPCTRASTDLNDERSGRWAGHAKTECGLHTL